MKPGFIGNLLRVGNISLAGIIKQTANASECTTKRIYEQSLDGKTEYRYEISFLTLLKIPIHYCGQEICAGLCTGVSTRIHPVLNTWLIYSLGTLLHRP